MDFRLVLQAARSRLSGSNTHAALLVLAFGCLAAGCDGEAAREEPAQVAESGVALPAPSLKFLTIETVGKDASRTVARLPGRIVMRPEALSAVGAPVRGRVLAVHVRPGEAIQAGKVVLTLQSAEAAAARSELVRARARAAAAEESLRRHTEMMALGVGLELERFHAETRVREARADLERARESVALIGSGTGGRVQVRSSAAGVVMRVGVTVGEPVGADGKALVELADGSRLWSVADVPERDTDMVAKGQAVRVLVPGRDQPIAGIVDGFGSAIDPQTRRLPIYVALHSGEAGVTPGMQVEVVIDGPAAALAVPVTAVLIKDGRRRIVYVQRADGHFEAREVKTGEAAAGMVAIRDGLRAGERVVVHGALLIDGAAEQLL